MSRSLCISFACSLILASPALAETDGEVYEGVDKIIAQATAEVGENLAKFVEANERPLGEARAEISELIARLNKEGRSQLATSLQKRLNGLEQTVQKRVRTDVPIVASHEPPPPILLEHLWANKGATYSFSPDGTFELKGIPRRGKYCVLTVGDNRKVIILAWSTDPFVEVISDVHRPNGWTLGGHPFEPVEGRK